MKSNVVSIADARPHLAGPALCIDCGHGKDGKWWVVAPVGTTVLECSKCGAKKGARLAMAHNDGPHWTCNCGNSLFFVTPDRTYCPNCGADQVFP